MKNDLFIKNNTIKDFSELEMERKQYFKYKMIEIIKIQEKLRLKLKKEKKIFEEQQDLLKETEKKENERKEYEKRENEKKEFKEKSAGDFIKEDRQFLQFSDLFLQRYLNIESINMLEKGLKNSSPVNPILKNLCKKRIGQISFDTNQCQAVINELQNMFIPELLPIICNTICEQAKHQISNHLESYKLYSLILFRILHTNSLFMFLVKKKFFLKHHSEEVFKGITLVYLGYLKLSNQLNEATLFLEDAISNENILSLIVMECFLIVFDNPKIFDRQFLMKIIETCKTHVFGKVEKESIKSRLFQLFSLI